MVNRIFKFRAWDGDRMLNFAIFEHWCASFIQKNNFPLMQFTGLKDKNDVEIYEGDVIELRYESITFVGSVIQKESGDWLIWKDEANHVGLHYNRERIAIVGNIYENPNHLEPR